VTTVTIPLPSGAKKSNYDCPNCKQAKLVYMGFSEVEGETVEYYRCYRCCAWYARVVRGHESQWQRIEECGG